MMHIIAYNHTLGKKKRYEQQEMPILENYERNVESSIIHMWKYIDISKKIDIIWL